MRKRPQFLTLRNNGSSISLRHFRRCGRRDVAVERHQLFLRFRRENDGVGCHDLAVAISCSVASLARTVSTETARDGAAFSAS